MIMNAILLLCMYPILVILYFTLANETKPKKNIILGATLPYTGLRDPRVLDLCQQFKASLRKNLFILALIPLPGIFIPYASIAMSIIFLWILPAIIVPHVIYARYRRHLLVLKKELLQGRETLHTTTYVDIQASIQQPKPVSSFWYLPPVAMGLIPVAACLFRSKQDGLDGWLLVLYLTMAFIPLLAYGLRGIFQNKMPDVAGEDSQLNAALTRLRRRRYSQFCLWLAWLSGVLCLVVWLMVEQKLSYFWGIMITVIYTVVLLILSFYTEFNTRRQMEQMAPGSPDDVVNDEDRYWIAGQFYYNPNDRHLTKESRIGVNTTINMAHPIGKILTIFLIVCLLCLPLSSAWMIGEEFTPISTEIINDTIVVRQLWQECEIPLEDIIDSTKLEERPSMGRIVGSSIGSTRKGRYDVSGFGTCRVYIQDPEGSYLLIITYKGKYLLEWSEDLAAAMPISTPAGQ